MYGYVYITHNKINGKIYIGQRKGEYDKNYFGSGRMIRRALKKYTKENFENYVIDYCETLEDANNKEIYWISKYNSFYKSGFGYNLAIGGGFGDAVSGFTDEQKEQWRRNVSENTKASLNKPEVRNKLQNAAKGNHNFGDVKGENHPMYGKKHSEETKRKISESCKNPSEEILAKLRKKVKVVYKNIEYKFDSRTECEKWFLENMDINVYYWMRGNPTLKYKNDIQLVEIGGKIKYSNK